MPEQIISIERCRRLFENLAQFKKEQTACVAEWQKLTREQAEIQCSFDFDDHSNLLKKLQRDIDSATPEAMPALLDQKNKAYFALTEFNQKINLFKEKFAEQLALGASLESQIFKVHEELLNIYKIVIEFQELYVKNIENMPGNKNSLN